MAVVTVSDRSARRERPDLTGPVIADHFRSLGAQVTTWLVADDRAEISLALTSAIEQGARVVVTTGGTGVGPRDVTPEATAPFLERTLPGIPELLRRHGALGGAAPVGAALSRGLAGVSPGGTVIVNLSGSTHAVESALEVLPEVLAHALDQVDGLDHS